ATARARSEAPADRPGRSVALDPTPQQCRGQEPASTLAHHALDEPQLARVRTPPRLEDGGVGPVPTRHHLGGISGTNREAAGTLSPDQQPEHRLAVEAGKAPPGDRSRRRTERRGASGAERPAGGGRGD